MRTFAGSGFAGLGWVLAAAGLAAAQGGGGVPAITPVVLRNVRVVDGTGSPPREHMTLVLAEGRIQRVCAEGQPCPVPPNAVERPDLQGDTVLPGLIAGHAHLALLNGQGQFDAAVYTQSNAVTQLKQYQRYGVTTIVSLGAN